MEPVVDFGLFELGRDRSSIEAIAKQCREKMEISENGKKKIRKLAADLGLKVIKNSVLKETAPDVKKAHLTDSESGKFYFDGKQGFVIYDDETCTSEEQEFTIAHEIGHYMLKHWETLHTLEWIIELLRDLKSYGTEMEADLFAEYLLGRCRTDVQQSFKEG